MRHPHGPIRPGELAQTVWGTHLPTDSSLVAVTIRRLRTKIEADPDHPCYVRTVRRVGYQFIQPVRAELAAAKRWRAGGTSPTPPTT